MPRQIFRHLARDLGVLVLPLLFPFQGVYFSTLQLLLYWNNDVPLVTVGRLPQFQRVDSGKAGRGPTFLPG